MKSTIVSCLCLLLCACGQVKGEPAVPGSPMRTEPRAENYKIESSVNSSKGLKSSTSMYLREPWRRVGLVAIGGGTELESALLEVFSASLEAALPHTQVVTLPSHSRIDDRERLTPMDGVLLIEVKEVNWRANEADEQSLDINVRLDCLGYPFDNVMYGGAPQLGGTEPSGEITYRGKVTGTIRSDHLLKKAAGEMGKNLTTWMGEWFKENCPMNPPDIRGATYSATVDASSDPVVADYLTPFELPENASVLASGENTRPSLDEYSWMVFEMDGDVESATAAIEEAVEGWLMSDSDSTSSNGWVRRIDDRYEITFVEPDIYYSPIAEIPEPHVAVRVSIRDLSKNEIRTMTLGMNSAPPEAILEQLKKQGAPHPRTTERVRVSLAAIRMRSTLELVEMAEQQLKREPSELDALLAYRLHPWRSCQDLTRRLYERAVKVHPEQFMVHRAQADFLAFRVKDATGAESAFDNAIRLLSHYELKNYAEELEKVEQSKRDALERAARP